jgi:hypothetical protein
MKIEQSLNYLILLSSALMPFSVLAQNARVVTSLKPQAKTPTVLLKWYSRELFYDEGVYIYRRKPSEYDWTKISSTPIKRKSTIDEAKLKLDPDLKDFVTIVNSSTKKQLQEDLPFLQLLIKTFQSNVFSDFLGIYFEDTSVLEGIAYEYKVNKIVNGNETPLGISKPILVSQSTNDLPVDSVSVFQKGKKIGINWKHEEERFYAVNIYRKNLADDVEVKLNKQPLVLSKVTDSLGQIRYPSPMFSEDKNLHEGERYSYQVSGVGFFENETQRSLPVEVIFKDVTPPPAPTNLVGKADSMVVNLKWTNVPISDLGGMKIYRSRKSSGPYQSITNKNLGIAITEFKDSLAIPGPYYYYIASVDLAGNEAHSNLVFVEVQDVLVPMSGKLIV